ncbi:flagellar motor switch protein FliM [Oribacterium sp. HCP28S3_H8]|uniref:flagellar motor switch protein FliM n=1 Tax=Oribacterium sp. HCP28S3_H8 TaxID=3438945 RepID=UPI003F8B06D1
MADVLSQSQIDELLKSMADGNSGLPEGTDVPKQEITEKPEDGFSKYDFYSPRKFTKEKLKLLRSIFENYARILTSQVNGVFRAMTDITVIELRETRYYEYVNSFHENDCMTVVDMYLQDKGKSNVSLMTYVSPGLIITLINHMLGGGDTVIKVAEDYRYTDVEMALYKRVLSYIIRAMNDGFANYINVDFRIQRVEENPQMSQDVGLDETVIMIVLNVDVSGISAEKIRICIPGTLLEHVFKTIDNRKHLARGFSYENNSDIIMEHIRDSLFPVTAELGRIRLSMDELYSIEPGDVIDMNKSKNTPITLYVGRQPWFTGTMGVHHKNISVEITDLIKPDDSKNSDTSDTGSREP